ncbi:MAG: tRNA modification GTPase [Gemmataceae bacterium]
MNLDPHDTIVALATPLEPGRRGIIRLSGPQALAVALRLFTPTVTGPIPPRRCQAGSLRLPDVPSPLPADLYFWKSPHSYTGQDVVELHTLSCPPLLELAVAELLRAGARAAQPGEFTLRAFLAGKLDLPRAEAVLGVIEARDRDELRQALTQLAGGVTQPLTGLRDDLLNLLADVEAGLDFVAEDIHFVSREDLLHRLAKGLAQLTLLRKQLEQRAARRPTFRVVLVGRPNAGKSSLFNALTQGQALVSDQPGTTRDYLIGQLSDNETTIELIDTAGWQEPVSPLEDQAQHLSRQQGEQADCLLLCLEAGQAPTADEAVWLRHPPPPRVVAVTTKCDQQPAANHRLSTSAVTGQGLDTLKNLLFDLARGQPRQPLAPSLSRCQHHVDACLDHLRQAHAAVLFDDPAELLALELRAALDQLGAMVGAIHTDDLLDRIFSRFCIGK